MEEYSLLALWGPRPEVASQCADRLAAAMVLLRECDLPLGQWFELGRPPGTAIPVPFASPGRMLALIERGQSGLEGGGFTCGLWNGRTGGEASTLFITCGASISAPGLPFPNWLNLLLGRDFVGGARSGERILCMFNAVIQVFNPGWASFESQDLCSTFDIQGTKAPRAGWITFVPYSVEKLPGVDGVEQIVDVPGHGSLLVVRDALDPSRRSAKHVFELHNRLVSGLEEFTG